jgi:23S rRNA (uracil1939-C5)-methyltransferase
VDGLTVRAERLVAGGDALARLDDGRVAFVPGALPGELVRASLAEDRGDYVRLSLGSVVEPSPSRVQPACPSVAEGCGGCTLQHLERGDRARGARAHGPARGRPAPQRRR